MKFLDFRFKMKMLLINDYVMYFAYYLFISLLCIVYYSLNNVY